MGFIAALLAASLILWQLLDYAAFGLLKEIWGTDLYEELYKQSLTGVCIQLLTLMEQRLDAGKDSLLSNCDSLLSG